MLFRTALAWTLLIGTLTAGQNVVVVLDDSGSMTSRMRSNRAIRKIDAAKQALRVILEQVSDDAQVGVLALNASGADDHWIIPLENVDRSRLVHAIAQIRADGGTPLGEFMKIGADALLAKRDQQRYGEYRLLVVTDGEANDRGLLEQYLPDILARGLVVDVIGVDMKSDHSLATRVHSYRRADDPNSLQQAIAAALAESDPTTDEAGESDFELLATFPEELAPVVLAALVETSNAPIVETTGRPEMSSGHPVPDSRPVGRSAPVPPRGGGVGLAFGMVCVFLGALAMLTLVSLLKFAARK